MIFIREFKTGVFEIRTKKENIANFVDSMFEKKNFLVF